MGIEIPQQNDGVPERGTVQHTHQGCQEGWVLCTTAWPVGRNNSQRPLPNPKVQRCNPLIHRDKPQHETLELGGNKHSHLSPPSLPEGHSRIEESLSSLKELGPRCV
ncbi:hypothetical protein ILYODFUR_013506 [Ilyodon furcidens]|uniref:Prolactin receptor n=1 Tax=Ilyodon furcidens TaxID=33524 RepID=A0ABV0V4D5_9TELE